METSSTEGPLQASCPSLQSSLSLPWVHFKMLLGGVDPPSAQICGEFPSEPPPLPPWCSAQLVANIKNLCQESSIRLHFLGKL